MPTFRSRRNLPRHALVVLVLSAVLGGCGGGEVAGSAPASSPPGTTTAPTSPSPTPADTPPASPAVREIEVQIVDGAVRTEGDTVEVAPGEAIRIVVTSDVDDELHVHGIDQTAVLVTGEPTTLELVFDESGVFEVETHDGGLLLFQLLVR
jgi:plastocyanin